MAENTVILRPISDINIINNGGTVLSTNPTDATEIYLLVNEEVADDDATYINVFGTEANYGDFSFTFGLDVSKIPSNVRITNVQMYVRGKQSAGTTRLYSSLVVNEVSTEEYSVASGGSSYGTTSASLDITDIGIINDYIKTNKELPSIQFTIRIHKNETGSQAKTHYYYLTQCYVEFTYEEITGLNIHTKSNDTWIQAQAAYQKQNGAWVEITENECKSVLASSLCGRIPVCSTHIYNDRVTAPTCTAQGYTTHICSKCTYTYRDHYTDATGHSYDEIIIAPTCTTNGYTNHICSVCGDYYRDTYTDTLAHTPGAAATCTTDQVCTVCSATLVKATGHSYNSVETAPTATANGSRKYTCVSCGYSYTEAIVPDTFSVEQSNRAQIGYTGVVGENLVIPAVFKDGDTWYRVTAIGDSAFYTCSALTRVEIPASVTTINRYAFRSCTSLTSVTIPASVTTIFNSVFYKCTSLTNVTFAPGSQLESLSTGVFNDCSALTSITLPDSLTKIGSSCFDGTNLTSITIPAGVTEIGSRSFWGLTNLTSIAFKGTTSQWNAIEFGSGWNSNVPATYVQCSDGTVSLQ